MTPAEILARALYGLAGPEACARAVAELSQAYLLVPLGDVQDVDVEFAIPAELLDDHPAFRSLIEIHLADLVTNAAHGFITLTERPVLHRPPARPGEPPTLVRLKITAKGHRLTDFVPDLSVETP